MTDGEWRIKQYAPTTKAGFASTVIPDDAQVDITTHGLHFSYPDGRTEIYPWASIAKAEYRPDPPS